MPQTRLLNLTSHMYPAEFLEQMGVYLGQTVGLGEYTIEDTHISFRHVTKFNVRTHDNVLGEYHIIRYNRAGTLITKAVKYQGDFPFPTPEGYQLRNIILMVEVPKRSTPNINNPMERADKWEGIKFPGFPKYL